MDNYYKMLSSSISSYYHLVKVILNDYKIDDKNLERKLTSYIKSEKITGLELAIFELIVYLNPTKNYFKSELNMKYIINILKFMLKIKGDKNIVNKIINEEKSNNNISGQIEEIDGNNKIINDEIIIEDEKNYSKEIKADELFEICSIIFKDDNLFKILFDGSSNITNKEEYLEMILLFFPNKETDQIIKVIKTKLNSENKTILMDLFKYLFRAINLNNKFGFLFLKKVLLKFLEDKENFINSYKTIENEFEFENNSLRCKYCFKSPSFLIESENEKIIILKYKCGHTQTVELDKLKQIMEYKLKCNDCKKIILNCNKYSVCSKCKNIVCTYCIKKHFENCGTIFFIDIGEIDTKCVEHNEKYEYYCSLCDMNLCKYCMKEHFHVIKNEKDIGLNSEDIKEFIHMIKSNEKNNEIIVSAIENLIKENNYKNNFQFIYFVKKILGNNIQVESKLFDELFCDEFIKYYAYMINQINEGNYYYLNILNDFLDYYEGKKINEKYNSFLTSKSIKYSKNQRLIMKNNNNKFALLLKYFNILYDLQVQKQLFNNEVEIKKGIINIEENKILIKLISSSEAIYQKELLKLIDRSIAESIIVYLIEKYPNYFKKLDLNLNIYSDLEKYYKNNKEKLEEFKINNEKSIKLLMQSPQNNNTENNENTNKIIFEKPIKNNNGQINIKELNQTLEFLFYMREPGNLTAHPTNKTNVFINPNEHEKKIIDENFDLEKVKKNLGKFLENEYMKKYFITPIKPKILFDCLFDSKYKPLIELKKNEDANKAINNLINESIEKKDDEYSNMEKIFENYSERIKKLENIYSELKEIINIKNDNYKSIPKSKEKKHNPLNEFYKRLDNLFEKEEKAISFLNRLNNNEYETSITGESYVFVSKCLDYIIEKILPKINEKIELYRKEKEDFFNSIKEKEKIINFLNNFSKKSISLNEFEEEIIDIKKINEYVNKNNSDSEKIEIDLKKIRSNLGILVNKGIDWTSKKSCKLSTLLFLKQNNY